MKLTDKQKKQLRKEVEKETCPRVLVFEKEIEKKKNQDITKEMVHEAWSIAIDNDNPDKIHSSLIPFEYLSDYIQDLDQYYVEKLTKVLEYLKELKLVINQPRK